MGNVQIAVKAFTDEQAARLAGLSVGQVRYWDSTGFFQPRYAYENRRSPFSRIYSFEDVVGLKTLGTLRNEHGVSLQHLRRVRDRMLLDQSVWADETIYVKDKNVYFTNDGGGFVNGETGEDTLPNIPLRVVIGEIEHRARQLSIRPETAFGQISKNRSVARKAEVFEGTRIPIDTVKEFLDAGYSASQILEEYPTLRLEDIEAAIKWLGIEAA